MNSYNVTNIKDLPGVDQILKGDYLVVENPNGTSKIDFKDFVVGPSNTSFYTPLATDVLTLSTDLQSNDAKLNSLSSTTLNSVNQLTTTVTNALTFWAPSNFYYINNLATVNTNALSGVSIFSIPNGVTILAANIIVQPYNQASRDPDGNLVYPTFLDYKDYMFYYYSDTDANNNVSLTVVISTNGAKTYARQFNIGITAFKDTTSPNL